jgi:A/G-specific adenine glycosylase
MNRKQIPFAKLLLAWNADINTRQMPWKGEKNPYYIWLSEIILQQTRVEQGLPYYIRFKEKYPEVRQLAEASEDEVMRLWEGLGYYSRARNLHETAKNVHLNFGGRFPVTFDELKKLKGVGDYTAAAIASFAFNEKRAVVDGNVIRVLARIFGITTPFDTTEGKKEFNKLAQELIDTALPGAYNQAIMDFGATVCTPQNPDCTHCPLKKWCVAFNQDKIDELPVRKNKVEVRERFFNYLFISNGQEILIGKRTGKDIWANLYQLPLLETSKPLTKNIHQQIGKLLPDNQFEIKGYSKVFVQLLTHRRINAIFIDLEIKNFNSVNLQGYQRVNLRELHKFAFPKVIRLYLNQKCLL